PDMTWAGALTARASATVTYSVTVNNPDTGNRILTNAVVSSTPGNNCPVGGADPRCTVTVRDLVPGLDIVATADTATATPGTVVHYSITATNTGQTAYTGASFTDPLAGVLDDAAYNNDGAATTGSVTFASPNLTWTGNLAVGAVATITFSVTLKNPETGNGTLTSTITSATVGNNCPAVGGTDPACTVAVTAVNETTLTFTATSDMAAAAAGGVVHETIGVANSGLTPYNGATFTAGLGGVPGNATYDGDATATGGTVTVTSPTLTWTGNVPASGEVTITYSVTVNPPDTGDLAATSGTITIDNTSQTATWTGDLTPGATVTITYSVTVIPPDTDLNDITLTLTVDSAALGNNCPVGGTDPACTAAVAVLVPALTITKTA